MKKEVIMISQNESMLVSERKGLQKSCKLAQKCQCREAIKNIESKLSIMQLKLQQLTSNVNISFTKHMQSYGKMIDEQKKRQNLQYQFWDMKQVNEAVQEKMSKQITKQQQSLESISEQIQSWSRMLRDIKNWKSTYNSWSSSLEKNIYHSFKAHKQENDDNIKSIYSAVEEIGLLQRRMLEKQNHPSNHQKSRALSYSERPSLPVKRSSVQQNTTMYGSHAFK